MSTLAPMIPVAPTEPAAPPEPAAPTGSSAWPFGLAESLGEAILRRTGAVSGADPGTDPDRLRVGVDLVPVADVATSVERLGHRYLYRIFTPHERACARIDAVGHDVQTHDVQTHAGQATHARYAMESLASRFAAKEAALKVLRPVGPRPEWRSIEVRRMVGGWCELRLTGLAASLAAEAGITSLAVSVTHEPMLAAACVVGMRRGGGPAWTPPPDWRGK